MTEHVIEFRPRPRQRVFVRLSGGRSFTIPVSEAHAIGNGSVLSEADVERLCRIDQYFRGKEKALKLLSIRSRSRHEIRTALDSLDLEASIRNGILDELEEFGYIDDNRFACEYIRAKVDSRQLGPHRLKFELTKRGVNQSIIDDALGEIFTGDTQEDLAWKIVRKKLSSQKPNEKTARRLSAMLRRKGFDFAVVNRVIYELLKQVGMEIEED
ncbi:MAG: hypothetical protein GTO51_04675 [Candidatus Latescibacteria bacterium]|nr:hypothetical protein [Candidatus Latescibacterota bacterium]NIM21136.1 hypothetical protein [Candidatus Latescibacterota bacterium]NIM65271.1 hypothetical protein [Candidatus Latescibacterota bacterium]NIO01786.1 hypothetical protein [Candidatus Latescibacterota bacterium]NIO28303.1 hypothetical protein [Candidatus Latescibacterota bacterium]